MKEIVAELLSIAKLLRTVNPYLNTPPTELARRVKTEKDSKKKKQMQEALGAWRYVVPGPFRKVAQEKLTPAQQAQRVRKRSDGVRKLAENLGRLRDKINKDLKSNDEKEQLTAMVVALMDKTAERVGNESSAKNNDHLGVTTFRKKNFSIDGDRVKLVYTGKSGVKHQKEFTDKRLATMLKSLLDRTNGNSDFVFKTNDGFKIKADRINRFLQPFNIRAKDIRGYAANRYMIRSLKRRAIEPDEKDRKKRFLETLKDVAERVGHTPGMLRNSYLLPNLEEQYIKKGKIVELNGKKRTAVQWGAPNNLAQAKTLRLLWNFWKMSGIKFADFQTHTEVKFPPSDDNVDDRVEMDFYTLLNEFHITATVKGDYLGATQSNRRARASEDWDRGSDLSDGPFSFETWANILGDMLSCELENVVSDVMHNPEWQKYHGWTPRCEGGEGISEGEMEEKLQNQSEGALDSQISVWEGEGMENEKVAKELVRIAYLVLAADVWTLLKENVPEHKLRPERKDKDRIYRSIFERARGDVNKMLQLARAMAKSIKGAAKAWRRYEAAEDQNFHDVAEIFHERARELALQGKF